jgi:bla regulator protein BlaR1
MNGFMEQFSDFSEWPAWGLEMAMVAGLWAGLLAGVVLVVNVFFRRWISARQTAWLWGLVLLRLLVPVAPSSSCSLQNLLRCDPTLLFGRAAVVDPALDPSAAVDSPPPAVSPTSFEPPAVDAVTAASPIGDWVRLLLIWTWPVGGSGILLWTVFCQWRFGRTVMRDAVPADERLSQLWQECRQRVGVRRNIRLVRFDGVRQPAVFGLFRPRLLLPSTIGRLSDEQLRMVMLHELAHVRRWHIAANWLLVGIQAVQWWNPVYWLADARFRNLREQSCDAFALQRLDGQHARDYVELLLSLAANQSSATGWNVTLPASILGFLSSFFRKRAIGNRIKALRTAGHVRSRWHAVLVAVVIGLVGFCGLTDAEDPSPRPATTSDWFPQVDLSQKGSFALLPVGSGPSVRQVYDISKALGRIAAVEKLTEAEARRDISWSIVVLLRAGTGDFASATEAWARGRFQIAEGKLTVDAPPQVQAEIAKNINAWEVSGHAQTCIGTLLLTSESDLAATAGISWQSLEAFSADRNTEGPAHAIKGAPVVRARATVDEYLPVAVAMLNEAQSKRLLEKAHSTTTANVMYAPKVTLFNGQQASISMLRQRPFVIGMQVGDADPHPTPQNVVIDEGFELSLRTVQSADAKRIQLESSLSMSQIGEVRTASAVVQGKPATIQIPHVKRRRIDVSAEIPDGQSLLLECIPTFEEKTYFYLLLTVRRITPN